MLPPPILRKFPPGYGGRAAEAIALGRPAKAQEWGATTFSLTMEYLGVLAVVTAVTVAGCLLPLSYRTFGYVYLLVVILLCLRVGRGPALFAVVSSALAWNYLFIPPRFSMRIVYFDDGVLLGTFFLVALTAGFLTTHFRERERSGRRREQQAAALLQLTRAVASATSLNEAIETALRHADGVLGARTAILLMGGQGLLEPYPAGTLALSESDCAFAEEIRRKAQSSDRPAGGLSPGGLWHLPLLRGGVGFGVFVVSLPAGADPVTSGEQALLDGLAEQIALMIEREQLRPRTEPVAVSPEANRFQDALLNSISHELKTPLSILRSAGERLETQAAGHPSPLIGEIRAATRRLDHLVGNLLSQTRLQSGVLKPQLDWCEVRDILQAARRSLDSSLSGHPLRIMIPQTLPLIRADAPLMEHVFSNLLLNAVLHTPPACPIEVSAGVDETAGNRRIYIRISDRGPGLPPELIGTLFQQFQRGASARPGGLGLGLSIVRGFVVAQGGDVVAENNPEGGARFTVFLPQEEPPGVPDDEE